MSATRIISQTLISRTGATCMARLLGNNATPITQATLSSILFQVWDIDSYCPTYGPISLSIAATIFNSLQNSDPRWILAGGDPLGYNFLTVCPAIGLSMSGRRFRADAKCVPVSGEQFVVPFEADLVPVYIP